MKYLFTILFLLSSFGFAKDITDDQSVDPDFPTREEWVAGVEKIREVIKEYNCGATSLDAYNLMMMRQNGDSMAVVLIKSRTLVKEKAAKIIQLYDKEFLKEFGFPWDGEPLFNEEELYEVDKENYEGIVSVAYERNKYSSPQVQKETAQQFRDDYFKSCFFNSL